MITSPTEMSPRIPDLEHRIIFEDQQCLIVDKPFDIPSTGKSLEDDDCLQFYLMQRQKAMIWAVHQLDADTTGVNIFVKEKKAVSTYKKWLESPNTSKEYLAIVHGSPEWDSIEERSPIGTIEKGNLGVTDEGKSAHSHFEVMSRQGTFCLIKVRIYTGRTHQIRIHLMHLGHPLVGEEWYCSPPCTLHPRQALHAWKVFLDSNPQQTFVAPLPSDLELLMLRVGLEYSS